MKLKLLILSLFAAVLPAAAQYYVGGDISVLKSYDDNNVAYYDQQGRRIDDVLKYMKSEAVGWNAMRVRLFVNPTKQSPDGSRDAQVCQTLDYVKALGKRIKDEGLAFMLDFHYSDTWADPANQWTPKAWQSLSEASLPSKVYEYTKDCLEQLVAAGATPDFIQTGNEISYGMLWGAYNKKTYFCNTSSDANWSRFIALLTQASKACREVCPKAQIIIHTERAGNANTTRAIYNRLASVDYDVIGLSYYPFWHGSLSTLSTTLNSLAASFPSKKVQIVETAYYYQWQPAAGNGFTDYSSTWPVSEAGQAKFARDLVAELRKHDNVNGLYWWFPEENGNGPGSAVLTSWVNRGLWNNSTHKAMAGLYELKAFTEGRLVNGVAAATTTLMPFDGRWYTLQGIQLAAAPQRRGLYINSGRKVFVK